MLASSSVALWATCPETLGQQAGGAPAAGGAGAKADGASVIAQWRDIASVRELQGLFASSFAQGSRDGAVPVTSMLFMYDQLAMSPKMVGMYMMAVVGTMLVFMKPAAALSDKYASHRPLIMAPAFCLPAVALAGQSLCTTVEPYFALGAITGGVVALQHSTTSPFIIDHAGGPDNRAQALALHTMSTDIGRVLGATTMGVIAGSAGIPIAMQATAGVGVAASAFFVVQTRPRSP